MAQRSSEHRSERSEAVVAARVQETGIDEAMIKRLVDAFYAAVRADPMLGPVFEERIEDWDRHLAKLRDFWSSIALMTGRFHGKPMQTHMRLPVNKAHFERWLALFHTVAHETCPPAAAEFFVSRAHLIAESLQLGMFWSAGDNKQTTSRV